MASALSKARSAKIASLRRKGTKPSVAAAIAYSEERSGGLKRLQEHHAWRPRGKQKVRRGARRVRR